MSFTDIVEAVSRYYSGKLNAYGARPQGVDWNSAESQSLRFEQLLKLYEGVGPFSINDYGCGYGALASYLNQRKYTFHYRGYDISEVMIKKAKELHGSSGHCEFFTDESLLTTADYTVASGIFNVRLHVDNERWTEYVTTRLTRMEKISKKGFAFNALTKYSDKDRMRPDLYYADPCFLFDYCKTHFSKQVALLHDYGLYEFTIMVRK